VLKEPFVIEGREVLAPASVGVAQARGSARDAGEVLRHADLARAEAKRRGGETWISYDEGIGRRASDRHALELALRCALDRSEMSVVFQPIFSLPDREVVYVESLVRWMHPTRGPVSPAAFIPIAEDTGVIRDIGRFVLEVACERAASWEDHLGHGPVVSVNVSVSQLGDDGLIDDVRRALDRSGIQPIRLALEITESMALDDPEATVAFLGRLRDLGVQLWIDDFGAGYSSLGHLHRLPVSVVKVDRMFTEQLGLGSAGESVVSSVVQLARAMGLRVIVEGVETDEQLHHLERLGVDAVQGFGLSPPISADKLEAHVRPYARTRIAQARALATPLRVR
jgi:EAL domain-containing protein (putative c-di-GMP-specific phosphodiesterase class I)